MAKKSTNNRSKSKSKNRKAKKPLWKKLLVLGLIILAVFAGIKIYEKVTNSDVSVGIIYGDDGPTAVFEVSDKVPVPADTVSSEQGDAEVPGDGAAIAAGAAGNANVSDADLGHEENSPLFFGNPSDAVDDVNFEANYLMVKDNYTMSYNNETLCPNWVAWHLDAGDIGEAPRSNKFIADKSLPDGWHGVTKADYQFNAYGFDRGHICPSADRTYSQAANDETFLMTNMVPQSPDNNRIVWVGLEKYQREIVDGGNEVYIIAGPAGTGGTGDRGYFDYILLEGAGADGQDLKINVPAYTWKVLLVLPEGSDDFSRVNEDTEVFAVCVPNKKDINSDLGWKKYLCSINDIEKLTGYDFFETLEDGLEEKLEESVASADAFDEL